MTDLENYQRQDLDELRRLFLARDPRGLEQMFTEDSYTDVVIEKSHRGDGGFSVEMDGSLCTFLPMPDGKTVEAGDTVRFYQSGPLFGGMRHGFAVNGEVIEYETPWDRFASRIAMLARHDHERRERFAKEKADIDGWYALLRSPYRERIDRFRSQRADFDLDGGSYEVYPVLMAQRIADWVGGPEMSEDEALAAVRRFRDLSHDEQSGIIHDGQPDRYGISGHQFDCACGLAARVLAGGSP